MKEKSPKILGHFWPEFNRKRGGFSFFSKCDLEQTMTHFPIFRAWACHPLEWYLIACKFSSTNPRSHQSSWEAMEKRKISACLPHELGNESQTSQLISTVIPFWICYTTWPDYEWVEFCFLVFMSHVPNALVPCVTEEGLNIEETQSTAIHWHFCIKDGHWSSTYLWLAHFKTYPKLTQNARKKH